VRPTPIRILLAVLALLVSLLGCSEKAARITGNERLKRGVEGLGTTGRGDTLVDRDTHVPPVGSAIRGAALLIGRQSGYEARSLFRPGAWNLPNPGDTTVQVVSVAFQLDLEPEVDDALPPGGTEVELHQAGAGWDTTSVEWPGPPLGLLLASGTSDTAPFTLTLQAFGFDSLRAWAQRSDTTGFVLNMGAGSGVRGFKAGTGRFRVIYTHIVSGFPKTDTLNTFLPTDLTIHTPLVPATGTEPALLLGGYFRAEALFHAPVPVPPAGFSINGASIVAYLESPAFPTDEDVEIRVYRIRNVWTEGVAADSGLGLESTPIAILSGYRVRTAGDSLTIPIPIPVAREWSVNPASNEGVLLRVTDSFYAPEIRLFSRESAFPPVLRLSTTTPPPGRF
jgi:4-amino-4-deoxy-L-arabinose transferase-like glycosyltransferase